MSDLHSNGAQATYQNPVYPRSFPDPFVLKFRDQYFAYCTDFAEDGSVFGVLRSPDLVHWEPLGGAMTPLDPSPPFYWAPEVNYDNGKFYLYYSVGPETTMEIRVAVSDRPDGGFVDSGHTLTKEDFAIDAHVFVDDDGTKYLFYATDFLDHTHIGTGTVVDRMADWFTLTGDPHTVTRARYDWQVYDPNRKEKGGVRWHTVEGPAVIKRKGSYYEMFSGGNWQNTTYGVSFAISDRIQSPDEWLQFSDGELVLPILRTQPGVIIGPGHNCIVRGPNNRELFCVYHRWTDHGRVMAIDRMDFAGDRLFVVGPTDTPQPAPFMPQIDGIRFADPRWSKTGEWNFESDRVTGNGEIELTAVPPSFLCEVTVHCGDPLHDDGSFGLRFDADGGQVNVTLHPILNRALVEFPENSAGFGSIFQLPDDFEWNTDHRIRIEADHCRLNILLDGATLMVKTFLSQPVEAVTIWSDGQTIAVTSFQLTVGFEELFDDTHPLAENGWDISDAVHRVHGGELLFETGAECILRKGASLGSFEFAANLRSMDAVGPSSFFGLILNEASDTVFRFLIDRPALAVDINGSRHALPAEVQLSIHHQLRILKHGGTARCYFDDVMLGEFSVPDSDLSPAVYGSGSPFAVEMVRLTAI
jgi:GH43 family beta-xylosidase